MVTRESFTDDPEQVEHLIRWWISQKRKRYRRVRIRGSVKDFINEVWCRILLAFPAGKQIECSLSTAICHSCTWEIAERQRRTVQYMETAIRIRTARRVEPSDRQGDCEKETIELLQHRLLESVLARLMVTLTFREAVTIRARHGLFGDDAATLETVGAAMQVSRERVRQIEGRAMMKLQHHKRSSRLIPFMEDLLGHPLHEELNHDD